MTIRFRNYSLFSLLLLTGAISAACGGTNPGTTASGDGDGDDVSERDEDTEGPGDGDGDDTVDEQENLGGSGMGGGSSENDAPFVASSSVEDGDKGILPDSTFTIEFSEPMDEASFAEHFDSPSFGDDSAEFVWNEDSTSVTIVPNDQLVIEWATSLEDLEDAASYAFTIGGDTLGQDGQALGDAFEVSFSAARRLMVNVLPLEKLTGHVRSDGGVFSGGFDVYVGDSALQAGDYDATYYGLIAIPLDDLVGEYVGTHAAVLHAQQSINSGAPDENDETSEVHHIHTADKTWETVSGLVSEDSNLGMLELVGGENWKIDVTEAVATDAGTNDFSLFALRLTNGPADDGGADNFVYENAFLQLSYWIE